MTITLAILAVLTLFSIAVLIEWGIDDDSHDEQPEGFAAAIAAPEIDAPRIGELIRARAAVTV